MNCWLKNKWCSFFSKEETLAEDITEDILEKPFIGAIEIFTELGSSIGALFIFLIVSFLDYKIWLYLFPVYVFQVFIIEIIKHIVKMPRPKKGLKRTSIFGVRTTSGSFPSGHTANAFALAVLFSNYFHLDTFNSLLLFSVAGLISISRIYLEKHYIIDVVGGAILGVLLAIFGTSSWFYLLSMISS